MKKVLIYSAMILSFLSCHKESIEEPNPPPNIPIDSFALTGKILLNWEYAHVYGIKYKVLPFGKTVLLPGLHNTQAKWSHGGDKIAMSDGWSLLILSAAEFDTLYYLNASPMGFAWSPDDSEIAVTFFGNKNIKLINIQTQTWKNLSQPTNYQVYGGLDWSGANNQLVFTAMTNEATNPYGLFTIHSDGTNTTKIASFADWKNVQNPRFSPSGTTIAFEASDLNAVSIFLIESTGESIRKYWDMATTPRWSADGTCLMANVIHPKAGKYGEDIVDIEIRDMVGNHGVRGVGTGVQYPYLIDWVP